MNARINFGETEADNAVPAQIFWPPDLIERDTYDVTNRLYAPDTLKHTPPGWWWRLGAWLDGLSTLQWACMMVATCAGVALVDWLGWFAT